MPVQRQRRSALYRIEAFGLLNDWNLWGIANGDLTDLCRGCDGVGYEVRRPCGCTEETPPGRERSRWLCPACTRAEGCHHCRMRCRVCSGRGMAAEPVHAEDFGDGDSLAIARTLFDVDPDPRLRINMHAQLLG